MLRSLYPWRSSGPAVCCRYLPSTTKLSGRDQWIDRLSLRKVCQVRRTSAPSMIGCAARYSIASSQGSRITPCIQAPIGNVKPVFGRLEISSLSSAWQAARRSIFPGWRGSYFTLPGNAET